MNAKLQQMLQSLRQFDNDYATKVRNVVMPNEPDGSPLSVGRGVAGYLAGFPAYTPADIIDEMTGRPRASKSAMETVMSYMPPTVGAATRYGVPAVGLTVAGQALADLSGQMYETASDTPILPM